MMMLIRKSISGISASTSIYMYSWNKGFFIYFIICLQVRNNLNKHHLAKRLIMYWTKVLTQLIYLSLNTLLFHRYTSECTWCFVIDPIKTYIYILREISGWKHDFLFVVFISSPNSTYVRFKEHILAMFCFSFKH